MIDANGKTVPMETLIGVGYTLATGRLFTDMSTFHQYVEELLGRPVFTHEFGDPTVWEQARSEWEQAYIAAHSRPEGHK